MKRYFAVFLSCILLSCCMTPALAESPVPMNADILTIYEELLTGTWSRVENMTMNLSRLPTSFTFGEDDNYRLFISPTNCIYFAWNNQNGNLVGDQFAQIAFSSDGQYLMLIQDDIMVIFERQS